MSKLVLNTIHIIILNIKMLKFVLRIMPESHDVIFQEQIKEKQSNKSCFSQN